LNFPSGPAVSKVAVRRSGLTSTSSDEKLVVIP
jgi:hypothetical protein